MLEITHIIYSQRKVFDINILNLYLFQIKYTY